MTKPSSLKSPKKSDKSGSCISRFFHPKPKQVSDEVDLIVLDDDSDSDANDTGLLNLSEGLKSECSRNEAQHITKSDDTDGRNESQINSTLQKEKKQERLPPKGGEDIIDMNHSDTNQDLSTKKEALSSPQKASIIPKDDKENPFAKFAYNATVALESPAVSALRTTWQRHSSTSTEKKRASSNVDIGGGSTNPCRSKKNRPSSKDEKKKEKKFVKMKEIPPDEQERIIRKWHSMADPLASLEDRRYQILLAARLHARCQEPTVRKAMQKLREHFASLPEAKTITVDEMAKSDPEELASHISSLQFYNVKAKQIVAAAQEIQSRHGGIVPEDEFSLLQITGIGTTFADLLGVVNTRATHENFTTSIP